MAVLETAEGQLNVSTITWKTVTWVNIEKPTVRETQYLREGYPFHPLELDDCLSRVQRPKIDEGDGYLFLVFHFPVFNPKTRVTQPSQVSVFLGDDYLVTLHAGNLKPLVKLFKECQGSERAREDNLGHTSAYLLYQILDRLVNYCFPILNKIEDNIERVEDDVFVKPDPSTVREILLIRHDLISFRRIIRPQIAVLHLLESKKWALFSEDMEAYFGDIGDHLHKIWDSLEDYREFVENLTDISNWLTSHHIQQVMRLLAVVAACAAPFAVIASIYGMNVPLPLGESPWGLLVTIIVMLLFVAVELFWFRRKGWI
ncbi:magnesium/cobalt transporter CorA [Chloroflexota bacterium]